MVGFLTKIEMADPKMGAHCTHGIWVFSQFSKILHLCGGGGMGWWWGRCLWWVVVVLGVGWCGLVVGSGGCFSGKSLAYPNIFQAYLNHTLDVHMSTYWCHCNKIHPFWHIITLHKSLLTDHEIFIRFLKNFVLQSSNDIITLHRHWDLCSFYRFLLVT